MERSISTDLRQSVELLPSSNGKIVSLLVTIPIPYLEERRPPYTTYLDIIKEFGVQLTGKQLVLLIEIREQHPNQYEQASIDMLKSSLQNEDLHIITTPKETLRSFSPWAQDAFLVAENSETSTSGVIIHPSNYRRENRSNDGSIAKEVADRHPAGYISYTFPAPIEAGNILVADDFILVGQDEILRSGYSESRFIQLFSNFFGAKKKIITVRCEPEQFLPILEGKLERHQTHILNKGDVVIVKTSQQHSIYQWRGKAQPVFHIDLFMTLLGRNSRGEQIILVGEPVADFDDHFLDEKEQQIFNEQIKDATDRINECIKNLKDDLNQHNIPYQILRNPLPLTYYNYHLRTSWYWASYNDCLVEISGGEKNVWLPRYYNNKNFENPHWKELRRFDEKSKEIFQQNGFNTYMFNHDFHALAANNGSLLSMTKCLQRVNIQQHSKRKIFYTVELIKTDSIYEMRTPEGNVLITKTEEGVDRGCMIKVENGELRVEEGIIQHPVLSSRMLLEGIEGVGIEMIDGVYLANVIADIDYRQRIGLKDDSTFTYKLGDYWVSFHVERVEQDGIEVDYLIINSKPER